MSKIEMRLTRTVFKQGNSLGVTLPPQWVDFMRIQKGDVVNVELTPKGLVISKK